MDRTGESDRARIWKRVKECAQAHHNHPQERGIASIIANDSGKTAQFVSDWKHERAPIPMATLTQLANLYRVSVSYLAGLSDEPTPTAPPDSRSARERMVAIVERVVEQMNPDASYQETIELCNIALARIEEGVAERAIVGELFDKVSEQKKKR